LFVAAFRMGQPAAGPRFELGELQLLALLGVLHPGLEQIVGHNPDEVVLGPARLLAAGRACARRQRSTPFGLDLLAHSASSSPADNARCGDRLSTVNAPATRTLPLSS